MAVSREGVRGEGGEGVVIFDAHRATRRKVAVKRHVVVVGSPLSVERHVRSKGVHRAVVVRGPRAVRGGIPASKGVAVSREGVRGEGGEGVVIFDAHRAARRKVAVKRHVVVVRRGHDQNADRALRRGC